MLELSRFFGIAIRMYVEPPGRHRVPHFHAYYQGCESVYSISPVRLKCGSLPLRQRRLVEAWAELHQVQLAEDWCRLQNGQPPLPIPPLQ